MILARHLVLGLCTAWLCLGAQAQVTRCTDARTGKVAYTDGTCNSGEATHAVTIRPAPEEVLRQQRLDAEALERSRQRLQADSGTAPSDAQRAADLQPALADYAPRQYDYARSPGCAGSRGAYDLLRIQQDHRSTREYGPLKEAAQQRMDMDCMGPEAYAERERQREQDRRDKEYREAALRRENDLRDQMERDHRYHQERERDKERQRERDREQAQREQAHRERLERERDIARREQESRLQQAERERQRDNRAAADRSRNESRPVQSGLSQASTGWRGSMRSNP
ncbi:hypothetical protein PMI14_05962 [Acidovorax sp. CF316]|uniref:DUF4124 domain-containing protein n=1 Tax=Acidovorax sp. CF316 TaxID=1144317 RepID=UPI00026BD465|nr:DUF4124 domain-containing protein [Acidovorax sp. CF316]EJE49483.1 hypothetical protein PMI14_05962 [Acidovorax sp. CF316]